MLLTDYLYIRGEDFPDHDKKATRNLLQAYIDAHSQRLIYEYPVWGVQAIKRLKPQGVNMSFYDKIRYNILFQQVKQKLGESATNYIKVFQNAKALEISVGNSYSEDQLIHTFL